MSDHRARHEARKAKRAARRARHLIEEQVHLDNLARRENAVNVHIERNERRLGNELVRKQERLREAELASQLDARERLRALRVARQAQLLQYPTGGLQNVLGVNYDRNIYANTCNAGGWHFQ